MLFNTKEIGDEGLSLDLPVTAAWLAAQCPDLGAVPGLGGVRLVGRLVSNGGDVLLRGTLRGALEATCSRCLETARVPLDLPLVITFIARSGESGGEGEADDGDDADDPDDVDVAHFDGEEVDLAPQIRDQVLLALPITPLCREDCAGLCPVCGGNRNLVACACASRQPVSTTPLAAALRKLKL